MEGVDLLSHGNGDGTVPWASARLVHHQSGFFGADHQLGRVLLEFLEAALLLLQAQPGGFLGRLGQAYGRLGLQLGGLQVQLGVGDGLLLVPQRAGMRVLEQQIPLRLRPLQRQSQLLHVEFGLLDLVVAVGLLEFRVGVDPQLGLEPLLGQEQLAALDLDVALGLVPLLGPLPFQVPLEVVFRVLDGGLRLPDFLGHLLLGHRQLGLSGSQFVLGGADAQFLVHDGVVQLLALHADDEVPGIDDLAFRCQLRDDHGPADRVGDYLLVFRLDLPRLDDRDQHGSADHLRPWDLARAVVGVGSPQEPDGTAAQRQGHRSHGEAPGDASAQHAGPVRASHAQRGRNRTVCFAHADVPARPPISCPG